MLNFFHIGSFVSSVVLGILWWMEGQDASAVLIWGFWISLAIFLVITFCRVGGEGDWDLGDFSGGDSGGGDGGGDGGGGGGD